MLKPSMLAAPPYHVAAGSIDQCFDSAAAQFHQVALFTPYKPLSSLPPFLR